MEHRFGQRIRRRELSELRLEVDRSPTPVDRRGGRLLLACLDVRIPPRDDHLTIYGGFAHPDRATCSRRGCPYPLAYHALQRFCPEIVPGAQGMGHCTPLVLHHECCVVAATNRAGTPPKDTPARPSTNGAYSARTPGVASVRSRNLSQLDSIFLAIACSSARFLRATSAVSVSLAFLARRSRSS